MLRSTFYSFTTALRGINTAQKQLDVTGQNISNVSTIGYTRQRADIYSAVANGYGDRYGTRTSTQVGQGVIVGGISQCRDQFLDVRYRREAANLGEQNAKLDSLNDLSLVYDEIESKGLMTSFNDFVSKLQSLAGNANSSEFDSIARDAAATLVKQFNQYASQTSTIREEKEYNLKEVTGKTLNDLMTNIAELNKSIREVQCNGGPALELKDERNLLLDQLSDYMQLDVKYTPKEVAGGIVVEDVSISMVGENGTKEPLIFNDTAATFNVKTKGQDGADRAIVTIDNSALPAKETLDNINELLKSIAVGNTTLQAINNDLAKLYPGDPAAAPPVPPLDYTGLSAKIAEVSDKITAAGGLDEKIADATTAVTAAQDALNAKLADTTNPPTATELQTLSKALSDAITAKATLVTKKEAVLKEKAKLTDYNEKATKYATGLTQSDAALKDVLADYNITATQKWTVGDYTSCYYTFEDNAVPPNQLKDADGNIIKWNVGSKCTQLDRDSLAQLGVTFTDNFDAEELASPGALKGAIDMLNSKGVFDYEANEVRGISYYESMLDSLADKLATTLNKLNDNEKTTTKEVLFQTADGSSKFTASNLRISDGWLNGNYGITATKQAQVGSTSASGQNDNILLMISTISTKMTYSTGPVPNKDANGNYLKTAADGTTSIVANGKDANGNYTLDGVLVCNKDMVNYKADGTLAAKTLSESTTTPGTYVGPDGTTIVANGKDTQGNYTMSTTDGSGKTTVVTVANADGVMYKTEADGTISKDKDGNPILDADESKLDYRSESFLYNGTFQEYLANISNVLSLDISSTSNLAANHETIIDSIQTSKDEISSVSLDEEGVSILQYQKAYNAAARLMTALDESVERIINQMGTVGR